MTVSNRLEIGDQFQFELENAINNPESTQPTNSFTMTTSVGETETQNMILTAIAGYMDEFTLNPVSKVVGASTTLQVRWKGQHTIPKNGYIFLEFPAWNPENPVLELQKTYIQGNERCSSLAVLSEDLSCDFQDGRLIVQNSAPATLAAGIELGFEVTGFKNPIETGYVDGFIIKTAVRSGSEFFTVDEDFAGLTVTEYATL